MENENNDYYFAKEHGRQKYVNGGKKWRKNKKENKDKIKEVISKDDIYIDKLKN